jgi:hypothetical protein
VIGSGGVPSRADAAACIGAYKLMSGPPRTLSLWASPNTEGRLARRQAISPSSRRVFYRMVKLSDEFFERVGRW